MAAANNATSTAPPTAAKPHSLRGGFGTQPLRDSFSLLLTLVVGSAASASGVGGGAFYVPLFDLAVGLGIKGATATSQVAVAAGSLAAVAARWGRRHPADPGRPVVDWQMAAVLQPPLLLGVSAGLLANHALPSSAITFALVLFLAFIAFDTCVRAARLHGRETAARKEAVAGALEEAARLAAAEEAEAAAEAAGEGGGGEGPEAARTPRSPRVPRPSSSYAGESMASLGTGSFLEDLFSVGAAKRSRQQQQQQQTSPVRETRSTFVASSMTAQVGGGDADDLEEGGDGDDDDDVSSLDLGVGSSPGVGSSSGRQHRRRSGGGGAASPPPLPPLSPRNPGALPPLSPRAECAPNLSPSPGKTATTTTTRPQPTAAPPRRQRRRRRFHLRALASNGAAAAQLLLLFAAMTALQVVRSLSAPCSAGWAGALAAQAALAAAATAVSVSAALAAAARGDTLAASAADAAVADVYGSEPERTPGRLLAAAAVGLLAGVVAALLGIGGGTVVVPLLLALGIHPQSAAATSTVLILFSSAAAAAGQGAAGFIEPSFAAAFGVAALAAGAAGVWLSARFVDRSGRSSLLVWLLAGVVAAGALLTAALGGRAAVEELRRGAGRVKPFCAP